MSEQQKVFVLSTYDQECTRIIGVYKDIKTAKLFVPAGYIWRDDGIDHRPELLEAGVDEDETKWCCKAEWVSNEVVAVYYERTQTPDGWYEWVEVKGYWVQ